MQVARDEIADLLAADGEENVRALQRAIRNTMTEHATHPLVEAYLRDLEALLTGLGPGERAEVLSGVREHIEDALAGGPQPGARDVQTVLAELGPPEAVADEAYAGLPAASPPAPPQRRPTLERAWVPAAVAVLSSLALLAVVSTWGGM